MFAAVVRKALRSAIPALQTSFAIYGQDAAANFRKNVILKAHTI